MAKINVSNKFFVEYHTYLGGTHALITGYLFFQKAIKESDFEIIIDEMLDAVSKESKANVIWVSDDAANAGIEKSNREIEKKFNNGDLSFDIEKIESFDLPVSVKKFFNEDEFSDQPFVVEIQVTSYFYGNQRERDEDFNKLKILYPQFSFFVL